MTDLSKVINGKSLNVHIVNPPVENPWRTKGDYEKEQNEARERHEMLQEQHKVILRSQWAAICAAIFAGISALATVFLVVLSYQDIHKPQNLQKSQPPKTILQQQEKS